MAKGSDLKNGGLRISVDETAKRISLHWNGILLTRTSGLVSIIVLQDAGRYYSNQAHWDVLKISDTKFRITLRWQGLPLEEYWDIRIVRNVLKWRISAMPLKEIELAQHEMGLLLSADYSRWLYNANEGRFPEISPRETEWRDIPLDDVSSKLIAVKSCFKGGEYKPAVIFDFHETQDNTQVQIRNSHIYDNLRGLFATIKHNILPGDFAINRKFCFFSSQIKLLDKDAELIKHIAGYKKTETGQRKQGNTVVCGRLRTYRDILIYFITRFKEHYQRGGLIFTLHRGIMYLIYQIKSGNLAYVLFDSGKSIKTPAGDEAALSLAQGELKLSINPLTKSFELYWSDLRLTKDSGFITVITDNFLMPRRHYSNQASWQAKVVGPDTARITLCHTGFPLIQEWSIAVKDEKTIQWEVWITPRRKMTLAEQEIGIMLSVEYTHWLNLYEEGQFPAIEQSEEEWKDMRLWNISSKSIGVKPVTKNGRYHPALIFDFSEVKEETVPIIRNSNFRANLRLLLAQIDAGSHFSQTNIYEPEHSYKIFSGKIRIISDEASLGYYKDECKKLLYRNRLPFIEEKMTKKYLPGILSPVDVVLANLPWKTGERCGVRAGSRWPHIKNKGEEEYLPFPFFLAYAASVLLEHGISVRLIDAIAEDINIPDFLKLVDELSPRLLIAEVSTPSLENDLSILKGINKKHTKIAVCGLDFNIRDPRFLAENKHIDFVMVGEYEYTALDLFRHLQEPKRLKEVLGIIYRENGTIKLNPARPLIEELDRLPWPLREQLLMEQYIDAPGKLVTPSVQMLASRGCPFGCIFCAWPQLMYNSNRYRTRRPDAIVDEMEYLVKERRFRSVYFDDDTFNINKRHVLGICQKIKERKLDIPWAAMARADTMDEEILVKMREAGLYAVKYGVECAEQKVLDMAGKGMDLKKTERMIYFTKSLGIKIHLTFTFGLPGETTDTVRKTIDYAMKLDPDTVQFSIMTPYPGTEYYNQLDAKGYIVSKNWSDYDGASKSVIRTEHLSTGDLEGARDEALRRWKRHRRAKKYFFTMALDQELKSAFENNLKKRGIIETLIKTVKYAFNIF